MLLFSTLLSCTPEPEVGTFDLPCEQGMAGDYPCEAVDLAALLPPDALMATRLNDVWGWADPDTGDEFVLVGLFDGTAVVDATVPTAPVVLGVLPSATGTNNWRDAQSIDGYAFIVAEERGHGMQVLHLPPLVGSTGEIFVEDALYDGFGRAHNILSLPEKNLVWAAGSDTCEGGLHAVDVADPLAPEFAGCWGSGGFVHDAQCVVYAGPDTDHQGSIICLAATPEVDDELHIVDFTDPSAAVTLSSASFPDHAYSHQGWLSEDHRYFFLNDEYDEEEGFNTRTLIFDVQDLDAPAYVGHHLGSTAARTHDEYVLGDRLYQANYNAGLDILDIINPATASLERVGRFDTYPPADDNGFEGAWGTYPYLPSGTIAVSSFNEGLFLLTPRLP